MGNKKARGHASHMEKCKLLHGGQDSYVHRNTHVRIHTHTRTLKLIQHSTYASETFMILTFVLVRRHQGNFN